MASESGDDMLGSRPCRWGRDKGGRQVSNVGPSGPANCPLPIATFLAIGLENSLSSFRRIVAASAFEFLFKAIEVRSVHGAMLKDDPCREH